MMVNDIPNYKTRKYEIIESQGTLIANMSLLFSKLDTVLTQLKRGAAGQPEDSNPAKRAFIDSAEIARTMEMGIDAIKEGER